MATFPKGWFFIKNQINNYVLSTEKNTAGEPVIISTLRANDIDYQLWQYGEDGRLHNKKTGFVLDVAKGVAKSGADVVLQNESDASKYQKFGLTSDGHIYLKENPHMVLGIKESFFTRRDGQHVHLQSMERNANEKKEQLWSFALPSQQRPTGLNSPMNSLKRTISGASLGSFSNSFNDEDGTLYESETNLLNTFPDKAFFIKSEALNLLVAVDSNMANSSGARLCLEPFRPNRYATQLWHFDVITGRLINKFSGFCLTAEELSDDSFVCQSSSVTESDLPNQSWTLTFSGEIRLKNANFCLGFKKDSWFNLNREGAPVLLQKKDNKTHSHQKFVIVLPVFKKKTTEISSVTERQGYFPEGYFFIKNQRHGLVISVNETEKLAAQVMASALDYQNFNRQLWRFEDGFLVNKVSNMVLDVRGGCIVSGSELCQYKQKKDGFENQQWGLTVEGYIHSKNHENIVLAISNRKKDEYPLVLANKKTPDHEEQRWNFVLPVFKQKATTVTETTVPKSVSYHHYAQYPSGWFFIRSFVNGSSAEHPSVLTADNKSRNIYLSMISKENWRYQLWSYWNGVLINFATQLAIDVDNVKVGSTICQELRQADSISQRWKLTIDGYLVHGSNPSLTLVSAPVTTQEDKYPLVLADVVSVKEQHRWGLLSPEVKVENGSQVLSRWSITLLSEWKQTSETQVQKVVHRLADWPEESFFITGHDGLALAPEKSEAFSFVVVKKLEYGRSEHFKWTYRNGYLVHVATGLVLHASDDLVGGSQLQIREELLLDSKTIDQRQRWCIKTDGSIVSELKGNLGFSLIQQGDRYSVQLAYTSSTSEHYAWGIARGHYESRYSEIYKKEVSVVSRIERILLTVQKKQTSNHTKLVTRSFGVFPENWFYICSKEDRSLVLTAPSKDEGAKLILSKIDHKNFRRQLWHTQDEGCLVNLESGHVIDVAGGAFNAGSSIIQWHEKYLRRYRKNQVWALSVDGHIHPRSRPGLVLGAKGSRAAEGSEIQLYNRGALDLHYQLWSFAIPIFGRSINDVKGVSAAGVLEGDDESVFIENVNETSFETSSKERYERETKLMVVRRWGVFPEGGFFIRASYGDEHLALTVERKPRTGEHGRPEYEVTLRPLNFKEYQWHFWFYQDGHLVNAQTGLALDANPTKGVLVEDGLRTPLFVREKSMSEYQFWSLTVDGEIYLRSDEHLVIGVSNSRRVNVSGAQVGLRELRVRKYLNSNNQQEISIKSEKWLRWVFSKPVYRTKTSKTSSSTSVGISVTDESSTAAGLVTTGDIVEGVADQELAVKSKEESADDYSDDSSDEDDSDDSFSDKISDASSKLNLAGNLGIATAGAGILAGAAGVISNVFSSAPGVISTSEGSSSNKTQDTAKQSITKKTSYKSLKYDRKESFHLDADYIPTGFEKVIGFKTHQQYDFPTSGYFMIKSHLHGFVFDIANGQPKDGAFVVLAPIKSTDFASQLWSYDNGQIVNLKGHNLVLDASMTDTVTAGERLVISTKKSVSTSPDQHWEFGTEGGMILLKSKRNLVLGVKELKRVTDKNATIDVYIQEEKTHLKSNFARPEQRWEIKIPAMIPVEQTENKSEEAKYTVIENGKISCISSSISAIIAFSWVKHTFQHKITVDNQWPSSQNWFFIRVGNENAFLSSGSSDSSEVKVVSLQEKEDHKQFLWVYVNGYLINYKYMLRLVYDENSKKLLLSKDTKTLDQTFSISSKGNLSVKLKTESIYFNVASGHEHVEKHSYELTASKEESSVQEHYLQLHIPVFSDVEVEKESKVALSTVISWVQSSQTATSVTTTTSTTTSVSTQYGIFPRGTWFFIKAVTEGGDSLVLTVKDSSLRSGTSLVLKKLNFKDYKSQLWTFRDGLLINYGSKYVIDVNGEITESSQLVQSSEAGVSSQKWSLTASGHIQLSCYSRYTFGYTKSETVKEDVQIVLVDKVNSSSQALAWRFSVPIFGKATVENKSSTTTTTTTTTTTATTVSAIERLTACIEAGAVIESVEEADIKVEDISVKKNNAVNNTSSNSATAVTKEKHHGFQDVLTSVGIAVTAGAIAIGAVEGASKIADKLSEKHEEKKTEKTQANVKKTDSTSTSIISQETQSAQNTASSSKTTSIAQETNNVASAVTDVDKVTEKVTIRRSQRTSVQVIEESRVIVRAWKIVFSQRVHRCKTKSELIQVIEESREDLFRRLDEHLRVHATVENLVVGAVPEWHVSIQQVKEIYRARIFEKFLDHLKSEDITNAAQLDFDSVLTSCSEEVESHYELAIKKQSTVLESVSSTIKESVQSTDEVTIQENVITAIDTIKVTVRYWLIGLYETVSVARSKGSSEEEIKVIVENSRKGLTSELTKIKATTSEILEKSSSMALSSKKSSITSSIETAIKHTETVVSNQVNAIYSEKQSTISEQHWYEVSKITEERLSTELNVYQTAVTQEITQVQKSEVAKSDQAEISVVLDEKMVSVAQQTVSNKLIETQTKISSWFTEVTQSVSWLLEESQSTSIDVSEVKQNTLAIVDAAQVELATRIEEAKVVLRAYYAHLTYLSWAERRRIEYSLENVKTSIIANITHFKKSIEKTDVTKEQISRYLSYSFGATACRIVVSDIQSVVIKVTNVKETTTVVNKTTEIEAEKSKNSIIGQTSDTDIKVGGSKATTETIEATIISNEDTSSKTEVKIVEDSKKVEKVNAGQQSKIDKVESEVEQTKVSKADSNQSTSTSSSGTQKDSTSSSSKGHLTTAILGAAAAAMAGAAIFHHHESKEDSKKQEDSSETSSKVSTAIVEKPTQASVVIGNDSKVIHVDKQSATSTTTKKEKSESLVVTYDQVQVTVHEWFETLSKRVYECAQKKSSTTQQEIDTIVFESQQQLVAEIEKAKRNTTSVIGTSQTSFHDTLAWIRSTVWKQATEVKQIGYQVASSTVTSTTEFEQKLEIIKKSTFEQIDTAIEKSKVSASEIHVVGNTSSAVIAAGKKFEGVDYSKTTYGASVETTKVTVGIFIEESRVTIQNIIRELTNAITERRKQGGSNVEADVNLIVQKHNQMITEYISKTKSEFEKRISTVDKTSSTTDVSKVQAELTTETTKKFHATLEQIQQSVSTQVSKIQEVSVSKTFTSQTEYEEKVSSISNETCEKLDATLSVSESIIGHHIEVVAESTSIHQSTSSASKTETTESSEESTSSSNTSQVSLGVEYGLLVVSETSKKVSEQISVLIEQVHHRITIGSEALESDINGYTTVSEKELDLILEQAKHKISYEMSMVSSHEKIEEEHFIASLESIRQSAKTRISQIQTVATTHKEETKVVSEKLLQIAEESRHEVVAHYESVKQTVIKKSENIYHDVGSKISQTISGSTQAVLQHSDEKKKLEEQKKEEEHKSSIDLAKKVLIGTAGVAAGTAIAVEIAKKIKEHKEKAEIVERNEKKAVEVIEDVKVQYSKWIASLTETVAFKSKQSNVTKEELSITIEKSKTEFLEIIKKTKSSEVITEKHQHEILTWVEQTAITQASRIQEIAISSQTVSAIDLESRLEIVKLSTSQEIENALEKCKDFKLSATAYVGASIEQIKQKEAALLDVHSELQLVIQDVKSSLVGFFQKFTRTIITRLQQGGDNLEKDVALLIANTRKEMTVFIETVRNSATKKLSSLESKSSILIGSTAILSGVATAELVASIKYSEELLVQKINRVHSSVWYLEKNQNVTKIVETIAAVETETTTEITQKIESSKHGFVTSVSEHHSSGTKATQASSQTQVSEHVAVVLEASLSVQEIKITIREWLRSLAEKVSTCSEKGGSSEEIDSIIKKENEVITQYIDQSVTKISATVKSEESIKYLHSTVQQVKSTITQTTSEIKVIAVEASTLGSYGYGGFDKMTSVITQHEQKISESLVVYETKISTKVQEEKKKQETAKASEVSKNTTVVSKANLYSVVVIDYVLSTVHTWFEELMIDVSECAKYEHEYNTVSKRITTIVKEHTSYFNTEFDLIIAKIRNSSSSSTTKQTLINNIQWASGMVLQVATQIQAIGINNAVSFSTSGGIEQMRPLASNIETQIKVAFSTCDKSIKIEVERVSAHFEQKKSKMESRKEEYKKKSECAAIEKKKIQKAKHSTYESGEDSGSDSDCSDSKKKKQQKKTDKSRYKKDSSKRYSSETSSDESESDDEGKTKKKILAGAAGVATGIVAGKVIKSAFEDSDKSGSDSEEESTYIKSSKLSSGKETLNVSVIVRQWYEKLIMDVSTCAKKGGANVSAEIEVIAEKATRSITKTLSIISTNAHKSVVDTHSVSEYQASIEWAKQIVLQSSLQIKNIGINAAASSSKTGGIEQMRPVAVSIQEQVDVEIRRYKLLVEKTETTKTSEKTSIVTEVEHQKNSEVISVGQQTAISRKTYLETLDKHVSVVIAESKVVVVSWFSQLIRDISIRIHQGGSDVEKDITVIIEKSKAQLQSTIESTHNKLIASVETYEKDKTFSLIESQIQQSFKNVQSTIDSKISEVQKVVRTESSSTINEKLSSILETSKVQITETFESSQKESTTYIQQETVQIESTVTIIETVNTVKSTIINWQSRIAEEVHTISIDASIKNKEEKINALIKEAQSDVERVTLEAKSKVSQKCGCVERISKSKEEELLSKIDSVHESFESDIQKIQETSISAIKKSETNIKESISSLIQSSRNRIDTVLTSATATVVGVATAAMAVHAINKQEDKDQKKLEKKSSSDLSIDSGENIKVISEWFELFTKRVSSSVLKTHGNVVDIVNLEVHQAEEEINEIIATARSDFIKRLSRQNLDQESYNYACKHYEERLETVRISIVSQIVEVKKVAIETHSSGNVQELESKLTKITKTSHESIKVAMGSSVVVTHKPQSTVSTVTSKPESVLHIEVKDEDAIVVGEQDVEFERKETSTVTQKHEESNKKTEKVEEKKKSSNIDNFVKGALAIGAAAGAAVVVHKKNEKEETEKLKKQEIFNAHQKLTYDSGITTIENVNTTLSIWFSSLVQKVSTASKSGASSQKITVIVEESRTELKQIIEHTKFYGSKFCASATDEKEFVSKIEWAATLAHNQATQIQQIGINASASRTDMSAQMTALASASYHQIEVTLQQLKTTVKFHETVTKITSSKTKVDATTSGSSTAVTKPVTKPITKVETSVDKTKVAYTVIQETRVATVSLFVSLSERIVTRIREGGVNVQEDIDKMIESTELEVTKVFNNAKSTSEKVDKKTRLEIEEALTSIHKSVQEQITEVKTVTVEVVSTGSSDTRIAVDKIIEVSKDSKSKIESTFTTVSEKIAASLIVVTQTAQKATETVQSWFSDLTTKITKLLEASDCSEEEKQEKVNVVIAEAEVEMKTKIEKLQQTTTTTTTTTTTSQKTSEVTADHHLDIFFGNIKSTVQNQLEVVKDAVKDTSKTEKSKIVSTLQKTETQLKQQVNTHCEAVEKITNVEKITGKEQKVISEAEESRDDKYKSTIVKTAAGAAAVAAAAALAIGYHEKNQQSQTTAVQVVKETSIKDVQVKIDTWLSRLTERVTTVTKRQSSNTYVEVEKIVAEAQTELDVLIKEAKSQHITEVSTTESKRTFETTLEYIKKTAYTQSSQITEIVKTNSSSSIDLTTQIENHVSVVKQQVNSALEVHYQHENSTVIEVDKSKTTQSESSKVTEKKEAVIENKVEVVTETKEQTQKRFTLETTVIVQESKTRFTNYLVLLLESLTSIIYGNSETIRKDIFKRLDLANSEVDVLIKEVKEKYTSISRTTATSHVDVKTQVLVVNSIKQTLDCIESIRSTLLLQITVLREVINRIEVEDINIITERLEAIITRTKTRIYHTLEVGIELAISSAFEGKVITWSETATIPSSFKKVRAVAFDVLGTVANYRKTLHEVWKQIVTPKNDITLSGLDFSAFIEDWYGAYTEIKQDNFIKKRPVSDDITLHEALVHILKQHYIKESFNESEIEQLCDAWRNVGVYDDAVIGIRRIKNLAAAKYKTVAISDTFTTRSMIELAQNNHLCWHAQFSADMFSSSTVDASQSVIKGTLQLLGLEHASQLAVVSANTSLLTEAKKQGCHAIHISREESTCVHEETTTQVDIKVDGVDVLGESIQSYLEHESMVQIWTDKNAPNPTPLLVQQVKTA